MFALFLLGAGTVVNAKCYDGGGNFMVATWPRCHEASPSLSVYSGLSTDGLFVKLGLHAQGHTKGWSGIGFSGNGGMKGASQIVVRLEADQWVAEDRFSLDYVTPTLDPEQNVRLIFAQDNGVNTSWGVLVPKDSCDVNDYATENVGRSFLWALGSSHTFVQHATRGQFHANLIDGTVPFTALTGVKVVDVKMPNATVISASTDATNPYICGIFDLRELLPGRNFSDKVHVAKFSPYLDPSTARFVHHMILYGCDANAGFAHNTIIPNCQSMPAGCNAFKWVWAVGGQDVQLPDTVGMPFGEGSFFLALQMHYYNPTQTLVNDTSGVTMTFTSTNRAIDAALMQLNGGTNPSMRANLPANTPRFTLEPSLVIPSTCTNQWTQPITVVGAIHHMHLVGVHQRIEVARAGVHLGLMRYERIYDFKHQSLEQPLTSQLQPGDQLKLTCDYDTTGKIAATQFGENTDNEMCWAALMFYPAQNFHTAVIQPTPTQAQLDAAAVMCLNPAVQYQNYSQCAEMYMTDPALFGLGQASGFSALLTCNVGPVQSPAQFAAAQRAWPQICPPCWQTADCTNATLLAHATNICANFCANSVGASLYPDISVTPIAYPQKTFCDGTPRVYGFTSTFPAMPQCVVKGVVNATTATTIVASILTDQSACPNVALKAAFADCSATDLTLNAGVNSCTSKCRTSTAALTAAFQAMVPVPSADQIAQCTRSYHTAWAPGGTPWSQWTVLEARLRSGGAVCDPVGLNSAPVVNPMALAVTVTFLAWFSG
jgi:hypothetical protein